MDFNSSTFLVELSNFYMAGTDKVLKRHLWNAVTAVQNVSRINCLNCYSVLVVLTVAFDKTINLLRSIVPCADTQKYRRMSQYLSYMWKQHPLIFYSRVYCCLNMSLTNELAKNIMAIKNAENIVYFIHMHIQKHTK